MTMPKLVKNWYIDSVKTWASRALQANWAVTRSAHASNRSRRPWRSSVLKQRGSRCVTSVVGDDIMDCTYEDVSLQADGRKTENALNDELNNLRAKKSTCLQIVRDRNSQLVSRNTLQSDHTAC